MNEINNIFIHIDNIRKTSPTLANLLANFVVWKVAVYE